MEFVPSQTALPNPPLYKQALAGLLFGVTLGPVVGWFIGTMATFFAVFMSDEFQNGARSGGGLRTSAFFGGLIGILFGAITGPLVGLPLRIVSSAVLKPLANFWAGGVVGAILGLGIGYLIHLYWHPSPEAYVYLIMHSIVVGFSVGGFTVIARPKWL